MKRKKTLVFSLLGVLLLLGAVALAVGLSRSGPRSSPSPSPTPPAPSLSSTPSSLPVPTALPYRYENATFRFSVRYPSEWRVLVHADDDIGFERQETPGVDAFRIEVLKNPEGISLPAYLHRRGIDIETVFANRSSVETITLGQLPAFRFGKIGNASAVAYVAKGMNVFRIRAFCCASQTGESVFDDFLRSWQFFR